MSPRNKVFLALFAALATAAVVRALLGEKRDRWFKRQRPKSLVTLRSQISMYFAIGTPNCPQGYAVAALLMAAVAAESLFIAFFL
ncbi:MAG: hypothetical protein SPL30_01800 [Succinivibrio sp.]|jgi:hypothetical protein|nr:hypothetical protein [Succinivibrio sp.]